MPCSGPKTPTSQANGKDTRPFDCPIVARRSFELIIEPSPGWRQLVGGDTISREKCPHPLRLPVFHVYVFRRLAAFSPFSPPPYITCKILQYITLIKIITPSRRGRSISSNFSTELNSFGGHHHGSIPSRAPNKICCSSSGLRSNVCGLLLTSP